MEPQSLTYRKGRWRGIVGFCFVTLIVKQHGLPFEASKGSDKRKPHQPGSRPSFGSFRSCKRDYFEKRPRVFNPRQALAQQILSGARKGMNFDIGTFDALNIVEPISEGLMNLRKF